MIWLERGQKWKKIVTLTLNIEPSTLDDRIDSSLCNTSH